MKYLLLGNSHAGSVMNAGVTLPGVQREFYIIPGGGGPNLELREGRLFPRRGEVRSNIDGVEETGLSIEGYDFILFSAFGPGAVRRQNVGNPFLTTVRATLAEPGGAAVRASDSFLQAVIDERVASLPLFETVRALCRIYPGRILLQPTPMPTEATLEPQEFPIVELYGDRAREMMGWYGQAVRRAIVRAVAGLGDNVTLLDYPEPAWVETGLAPVEYGLPTDPWHMTPAYGALVMAQVKAVVGA